jgi:hypothetical protein
MDNPFNKILIFYAYKSLDRKWYARTLLKDKKHKFDDATLDILNDIATSSFKYCECYFDRIKADVSLNAITKLCNNSGLMYDVMGHDAKLFVLSRTFNQVLNSGRILHRCYDCGTNARAIFMQLIEAHRGKLFLTAHEQMRIKREYQISYINTPDTIEACHKRIVEAKSDTVFLMSLSIEDFGHVWVIEKLFLPKAIRYHLYQSSFRSHMLLDYIEEKDYGRNPEQSMDIELFFEDFKNLMSYTDEWTDEHYRLFTLLFSFMSVNPVINPNPGFCFTSVTYDLNADPNL